MDLSAFTCNSNTHDDDVEDHGEMKMLIPCNVQMRFDTLHTCDVRVTSDIRLLLS